MSRILLIEPDKTLAWMYQRVLETAGHAIRMCHSAQNAITAADAFKPELVLTEIDLANNNGVEFLYEFRSYADWRHIPVIILSGVPANNLPIGNELWQQLGIAKYLYKPSAKLQDIVSSVHTVLST